MQIHITLTGKVNQTPEAIANQLREMAEHLAPSDPAEGGAFTDVADDGTIRIGVSHALWATDESEEYTGGLAGYWEVVEPELVAL